MVVCTPQDLALLDAVKAVAMFRKVQIPVLGMVENMSYFLCPNCKQRYDIFGSGGAQRRAAELSIPFLGEVPIQISIRTHGDAGETPPRDFDDPQTRLPFFESIAHRIVRNLADQHRRQPPLPSLPRFVNGEVFTAKTRRRREYTTKARRTRRFSNPRLRRDHFSRLYFCRLFVFAASSSSSSSLIRLRVLRAFVVYSFVASSR